jgi:hypothetical protein
MERTAQDTPGSQPTQAPHAGREASWKGRLNAAARELSARATEIVDEGNRRQFVVEREGRNVVSVPLTIAAAFGSVAVLVAPWAVLLGAAAALMARVHARVEREAQR